MNLYSLSETRPEYLEVGYARSGRSTCRTCKQKIEISTLRIAICMDDPRFSRQDWYHLPCFELKPRFKDVDPDENVYRIDELDPEDYDKVINRLTE